MLPTGFTPVRQETFLSPSSRDSHPLSLLTCCRTCFFPSNQNTGKLQAAWFGEEAFPIPALSQTWWQSCPRGGFPGGCGCGWVVKDCPWPEGGQQCWSSAQSQLSWRAAAPARLLPAPGFHKMARGGKCRAGGAVKPVPPLQAGRAGLLHGNGWVKSSLDACRGGWSLGVGSRQQSGLQRPVTGCWWVFLPFWFVAA